MFGIGQGLVLAASHERRRWHAHVGGIGATVGFRDKRHDGQSHPSKGRGDILEKPHLLRHEGDDRCCSEAHDLVEGQCEGVRPKGRSVAQHNDAGASTGSFEGEAQLQLSVPTSRVFRARRLKRLTMAGDITLVDPLAPTPTPTPSPTPTPTPTPTLQFPIR